MVMVTKIGLYVVKTKFIEKIVVDNSVTKRRDHDKTLGASTVVLFRAVTLSIMRAILRGRRETFFTSIARRVSVRTVEI